MRKTTHNHCSSKLSYKNDSKPTEESLREEKLINAIKLLHQNDTYKTEYKGKYIIPALMHLGLHLLKKLYLQKIVPLQTLIAGSNAVHILEKH